MKAIPLPAHDPAKKSSHYVHMSKSEKPLVDRVVSFARKHGATYTDTEGEEVFLVRPPGYPFYVRMNRYTLRSGLA